jgi:hypothetical protein
MATMLLEPDRPLALNALIRRGCARHYFDLLRVSSWMGKSWLSDLTVIVISSPWTVPVWVIVPKLKTAAKEIFSPST